MTTSGENDPTDIRIYWCSSKDKKSVIMHALFTFPNDTAIYWFTLILIMEYIYANILLLTIPVMGKPIKSERHFLPAATIGTRSLSLLDRALGFVTHSPTRVLVFTMLLYKYFSYYVTWYLIKSYRTAVDEPYPSAVWGHDI